MHIYGIAAMSSLIILVISVRLCRRQSGLGFDSRCPLLGTSLLGTSDEHSWFIPIAPSLRPQKCAKTHYLYSIHISGMILTLDLTQCNFKYIERYSYNIEVSLDYADA